MENTPLSKHNTITHNTAVLVAYYGLTISEAYDALISAGYDMNRAVQLVEKARAAGVTLTEYLSTLTSGNTQ